VKVEEIKKLKSGKYKVKIDGESITTYDDVILENHLLFHKDITEEELGQIQLDHAYAEVYHKALSFALRKLRSTYEMNCYLEKFEISEGEKETILDRLKKNGIVSDVSFVRAYISDCLYLSNDGPNKIYKDLLEHQIEESIILEELDKIDISYVREKLQKLITKRIKGDHKHSNYQLKQKIVLDMVNLGYDRETIIEILSSMELTDSDKMEREYDKIYQKLSRKYEGKELFKKIQEKLYGKGFDIHEIENFIAEKKSDIF